MTDRFRDKQEAKIGHAGELLVETRLRERGCGTVPCYDFSGADGEKAPKLQFVDTKCVIPDLDVMRDGRRFWAEVKTYWGAPLNRTHGVFVHGVRDRHRKDYLTVERVSGCKVRLMVLEISSGVLLTALLNQLKILPCLCAPCKTNAPYACVAGKSNKRLVYFDRDQMREVHVFDDEDLIALRELHGPPPPWFFKERGAAERAAMLRKQAQWALAEREPGAHP